MAGRNLEARRVRKELADMLFEQQQLMLVLGPNLEARFHLEIGKFQAELEQLRLQRRRARRNLELRRAALVKGLPCDRAQVERQLDQELYDYQRRVQEQKEKQDSSQQRLKRLRSAEVSAAMRSLYRVLVKRLHPDLHPHSSPEQQRLWFEVQQAYQWCDWKKLETLVAITDDEHEAPEEEDLERLQQRLGELSRELRELHSSFPFNLQKLLDDPHWIQSQVAQLKLEIVLERVRLNKLETALEEFL